ncbi:MAG: hypothetical protein QM528_05415 [Phycisphaerales bacterium]|nr:hypothetical protein [Phycisphaerales bacterium]
MKQKSMSLGFSLKRTEIKNVNGGLTVPKVGCSWNSCSSSSDCCFGGNCDNGTCGY